MTWWMCTEIVTPPDSSGTHIIGKGVTPETGQEPGCLICSGRQFCPGTPKFSHFATPQRLRNGGGRETGLTLWTKNLGVRDTNLPKSAKKIEKNGQKMVLFFWCEFAGRFNLKCPFFAPPRKIGFFRVFCPKSGPGQKRAIFRGSRKTQKKGQKTMPWAIFCDFFAFFSDFGPFFRVLATFWGGTPPKPGF